LNFLALRHVGYEWFTQDHLKIFAQIVIKLLCETNIVLHVIFLTYHLFWMWPRPLKKRLVDLWSTSCWVY